MKETSREIEVGGADALGRKPTPLPSNARTGLHPVKHFGVLLQNLLRQTAIAVCRVNTASAFQKFYLVG